MRARGRGTGGASGRAARGPEDPMSYDLAFRYSQALDPSALVMIGTTLHAIHAAITDCRNAGLDLESDPAIILLARHLGTVCAGQPSQAARPLPTRYAGRSEEHTSELKSLMRISY